MEKSFKDIIIKSLDKQFKIGIIGDTSHRSDELYDEVSDKHIGPKILSDFIGESFDINSDDADMIAMEWLYSCDFHNTIGRWNENYYTTTGQYGNIYHRGVAIGQNAIAGGQYNIAIGQNNVTSISTDIDISADGQRTITRTTTQTY